VDLAVGEAGAVVDYADDFDLAGLAVAVLAFAVGPVAWPVELGQLESVDVQ
jgi:hypothetical protein